MGHRKIEDGSIASANRFTQHATRRCSGLWLAHPVVPSFKSRSQICRGREIAQVSCGLSDGIRDLRILVDKFMTRPRGKAGIRKDFRVFSVENVQVLYCRLE